MADEDPLLERIAVAVVVERERVLVGRRPLGVSMAGFSEFPGGKIEGEETPSEAAARECLEETGVRVEVKESMNVAYQSTPEVSREIHFMRCSPIGRHVAKSPFDWVPLARVNSLRFPPPNAEVLKILQRMSER